MHARETAEPLYVLKRIKAFTRLIHTWAFRIWPRIDQKVIFGHVITIFLARPILNVKELVIIILRAQKATYTKLSLQNCQQTGTSRSLCFLFWYLLLPGRTCVAILLLVGARLT